MKLLTVALRNYRVHKVLSITFDPARTVIGGPNEAGKSTLVEAVHHAFFLRSRVTGTVQKSMLSEFHTGHPTVELRFESGDHDYTITKVFSGNPSASTTLKEHASKDKPGAAGGRTLHDEEAEARIHEILQAEDIGGGRNVETRIRMQWAHLWIWQGSSTDDPLAQANADRQAEMLRERLARVDGGGVLESPLDAAAARDISARHAAMFTDKGKVRSGCDLDLANDGYDRAEAAHAQAAAAVEMLNSAVDVIDLADRTIAVNETKIGEARDELEGVRVRQRQAAELGVQVAEEHSAATAAESLHAEAVRADAEIVACHQELTSIEQKMEPALRALADLEREELECTVRCDVATKDMVETGRRQTVSAAAFALHDVREKYERLHTEREGLSGRCSRIAEQRQKAQELGAERTRLPAVTAADMAELSRLDRTRDSADATLQAIATRVEVLTAAGPVTLGGVDLDIGSPVTITASAELLVGSPVASTVRISPGGGRSLAEATHRLEEARTAIDAALTTLGVASIETAREAHARRQALDADIHAVNLAIEGLGGDEAEADLMALDGEIKKVDAEIHRRAPGGGPRPASLAAAQDALVKAERELTAAGEAAANAGAAMTAARERLEVIGQKWRQATERLHVNRTELENLRTKAVVLEERHGTERASRIAVLDQSRAAAAAQVAASRTRLARLSPEALELDRQRLERTLIMLSAAKQDAETKRQLARARLELEGTTDPREDLARAAARRRLVAVDQARANREVEAVRLLATLFSENKRAVESQFVAPLASRVSSYLERLYGEGTTVGVDYEGGRFSRLTLSRRGLGDTRFEFSQLSSGAKEQVGAAFRLAMAEVLAEDHDGCLPIVFDDAFVNSDSDRQRALQRLLDLGASRGLQVIVLTCRPESYATLGATTVTLADNPYASG